MKTQRVKVNMTAFSTTQHNSTPIGRTDYTYHDELGMTMRKPVTFLQYEDSHSIKDPVVISTSQGRAAQILYLMKS